MVTIVCCVWAVVPAECETELFILAELLSVLVGRVLTLKMRHDCIYYAGLCWIHCAPDRDSACSATRIASAELSKDESGSSCSGLSVAFSWLSCVDLFDLFSDTTDRHQTSAKQTRLNSNCNNLLLNNCTFFSCFIFLSVWPFHVDAADMEVSVVVQYFIPLICIVLCILDVDHVLLWAIQLNM